MTCSDLVSYTNETGWQPKAIAPSDVPRASDTQPSDAMTLTLASLTWPQWRAGGMELGSPWGVAVPEGRISFYLWRRGTGILISPGRATPMVLNAGDVVLVPSAISHSLRSDGASEDLPFEVAVARSAGTSLSPSILPISSTNLSVEGEVEGVSFIYGQLSIGDMGFNPLEGKLPSLLHIPASSAELPAEWQSLLQVLDQEQRQQRPGWQAIVRQLVRILFHQVIRSYLTQSFGAVDRAHRAEVNGDGQATADPAIRLVVGLLHAELGKPWTVTSLAKWIHMSRSAFSARFREVVGQPPLQYLTEVRMQRACEFLCESNLGIKQIATAVGYESPSSFTNAFKRWRGMSPIAYRIKHHPELHNASDEE